MATTRGNEALRQLAKQQLFVMDLGEAEAGPLLAAQLGGDGRGPVIWREAESELMVLPARTRVKLAPGFVFVELWAQCDQTGLQPLVFSFKIGASPNEATLVAATEPMPRGHATLATRWAEPATTIVWHAVLRAGQSLLARRRQRTPLELGGVYTLGRVLSFISAEPVDGAQLQGYYEAVRGGEQPLDLSVLNRRFLGSVPLKRRTPVRPR
ncbi:MAG: hypothetical protein JNJ71_09685 [Rubrivivax sp.]|nr:hypothetical protein [Rubrivivax sp.]